MLVSKIQLIIILTLFKINYLTNIVKIISSKISQPKLTILCYIRFEYILIIRQYNYF